MNPIQFCIRYPVTTAVGVIFLVLFGFVALFNMPVQLTPEVTKPEITVTTIWPGASPQEVERDIVDEQEEELKSLEGLVQMRSESQDGQGIITLQFEVGTDKDAARLKVSNRLDQVEDYPANVEKPIITGEAGVSGAIAWFHLELASENSYEGDISTLYDFMDDYIVPELERVEGVSKVNIFGGREAEVHVSVDPARLALRQVTLSQLAEAIERENRNYSGGDFDEAKRRYIVRTVGEYRSVQDLENIVIARRNNVPVYLRDVARVELSHEKPVGMIFSLNNETIAMNIQRQVGANELDIMAEVRRRVDTMNKELLEPMGLHLQHAWDQTSYINSAIDLVRNNLFIGGSLAILVLLVFLRNGASTLVAALTIPISIIGTFLMMGIFDRSLNVISLAGLAFATGMVVDNSIVVLENIYRHRQAGKSLFNAAYDGAGEVWGAVLASTLTTIAVFAPVMLIEEEIGQLFADIAVAISCAVGLSLIVAITVIPTVSARILRVADNDRAGGLRNLWGGVSFAARLRDGIASLSYWINESVLRRLVSVSLVVALALGISIMIIPKTEYLPTGNTDFLFGLLLPPPGYTVTERASIHDQFAGAMEFLKSHPPDTPAAEQLPGAGLDTFFFGFMGEIVFMGVTPNDPLRTSELLPIFHGAMAGVPGAIPILQQWSIFEDEGGEGRSIDVEIKGPDLERLIALGGEVFAQVSQVLPGAQAFPIPGLDLGNPEVQVAPDRRRAAELGISNRELGFAVNALVDGVKVSDYQHDGKEIDIRLKAEEGVVYNTHTLEQLPVATPDGRLVTLGSIADVTLTSGPVQINHRERERTITIRIAPATQMPTEAAMEIIRSQIVEPMQQREELDGLYRIELTGSADKLASAGAALKWNLILALIITFLLMSALFESFLYPLVILFSLPLAALGGFLGLAVVNAAIAYQPLDVLTMLGFIILLGTVVNNPILIVHQSLNYIRKQGLEAHAAIRAAVHSRIRPIFMSAGTSTFAMLPLILAPGAGSELYRGIGGVVIGGLLLSTLFTLFIVPAMLSLVLDLRKLRGRGQAIPAN